MTNNNGAPSQELAALKQRLLEKQQKQASERAAHQQIESLLRHALVPEAKERLGNVRLVNPELYLKTVQSVLYLFQNQSVKQKITDAQLKQLLEKLSAKRATTITRK